MNDIPENENSKPVEVKVCKLAVTAVSLALSGLILTFILLFTIAYIRPDIVVQVIYILTLTLLISAICLGIISAIQISTSGGKKTGEKFASLAIILPLFTFVILGILLPMIAKMRPMGYRMVCGSNLYSVGKAMLIYANDYDGKFPRAGGENTTWGQSVNYNAPTQQEAFGLSSEDGSSGSATISSSLYLLVKYNYVSPKSFICKEDKKVSEFKVKDNIDLNILWDFGFEPWKHNSYSYHMPYGEFSLTTSSEPDMALAADRNPWIPSSGWKVKNFQKFNPDGTNKREKDAGNSQPHSNMGQNVLYLDTHVVFDPVSFCGINEDNIYTSWNGSDIRKGTPPQFGSQSASSTDSLLVNDSASQKH